MIVWVGERSIWSDVYFYSINLFITYVRIYVFIIPNLVYNLYFANLYRGVVGQKLVRVIKVISGHCLSKYVRKNIVGTS